MTTTAQTNNNNTAQPGADGKDCDSPEDTLVEPLEAMTDKCHANWRSRFRRDPDYRHKVIRSVWVCLCFFSLGLGGGQRGPAFLDLQLITNTTVQQASAFFTAGSAGYVTGSLLSGFVYDLWSKSLLLIISVLCSAVLTASTPFCWRYWLMVCVSFLGSCFGGAVDTVGNADVLRTWKGQGQAALQAIHFTFAVGGVVAPLITEPFLAATPSTISHAHPANLSVGRVVDEMDPAAGTIFNNSGRTSVLIPLENPWASGARTSLKVSDPSDVYDWEAARNVSGVVVVLVNGAKNESTPRAANSTKSSGALNASLVEAVFGNRDNTTVGNAGDGALKTRVHYAYMISALVALLSAMPLIVQYIHNKIHKKRKRVDKKLKMNGQPKQGHDENKRRKSTRIQLTRMLYVCMLAWVCGFYMLYTSVEDTFGAFLTYYVVHQMEWSKSQGALLTSVFWISFAASRFACIFLAKALSPAQLLLTCFALLVVSFLGFLLSSLWQLHWGVWVSSAVSGAAMCAVFPSGLTWTDTELLPVTGRVTSAVVLSASLGLVVNPLVLGHLMQYRGAIWLAYILLGEVILCVLTFLLLFLYSRLYLQRRHTIGQEDDDVSTNRASTNENLPECSQRFLDTENSLQETV